MEVALIIILVIAFVGFVVWMKRRQKNPVWYQNPLDRALALLNVAPVTTPGGIKVYYEKGVTRVDHNAIDSGFDRVWSRVACRYPVNRSQHDRKVVVVQGERAPESGTWAFRVPINGTNPYFNGEWDMMRGSHEKVHYVLAAGQMIAVGQPYGDVILIPSSPDAEFVRNIVDYEFEHCLLGWYDGDEFERTKYHGEGTGHPVIPPCPGSFLEGRKPAKMLLPRLDLGIEVRTPLQKVFDEYDRQEPAAKTPVTRLISED